MQKKVETDTLEFLFNVELRKHKISLSKRPDNVFTHQVGLPTFRVYVLFV